MGVRRADVAAREALRTQQVLRPFVIKANNIQGPTHLHERIVGEPGGAVYSAPARPRYWMCRINVIGTCCPTDVHLRTTSNSVETTRLSIN